MLVFECQIDLLDTNKIIQKRIAVAANAATKLRWNFFRTINNSGFCIFFRLCKRLHIVTSLRDILCDIYCFFRMFLESMHTNSASIHLNLVCVLSSECHHVLHISLVNTDREEPIRLDCVSKMLVTINEMRITEWKIIR